MNVWGGPCAEQAEPSRPALSCTEPAIPTASAHPDGAPGAAVQGGVQPGAEPGARVALPEGAHIVILRFTSLGDVVKATILPRVIRARYPRARITMVTAEAHLPLIEANPYLTRAVGFERRAGLLGLWRLARSLRAERVDLIVDVHRSLRSRLLTAWVGAPRVSYRKHSLARNLLVHFGWNFFRTPKRKDQEFVEALADFGVRDDGRGTEISLLRVLDDTSLAKRFAQPLEAIRRWREGGRPVVGVAPVAAWELKRWPLRHVRAWMEGYVRETGGGIVLFGGAADRDVPPLARGLEQNAVSIVGAASLLESAWFASLCDVMIANDTGMSHLAEAVGRDTIVLFGPTSEEWGYFPVRPRSRVMQRALHCRPCTRMGEGRCTHALHKACLVTITPEAVLEALKAVLREQQADGAARP